MTVPKDLNNFPVTNPKDMEICDLANKEFKISGLRKLNELQGNRNSSVKSGKQNEKFKEVIKIIKKEPNSRVEEYSERNKTATDSINNRRDQEKRTC